MDSQSLYFSLELVAGSGDTLNVEQRTALHTSLLILQKNHKFKRVVLWGKVLGLKGDYFIAQGRGEDEMKDRKNLYSLNCVDWFLLPPATDPLIDQVSRAAKGGFTGDPSHVYEHREIHRRGGGDEEEETKVNEESRLAVTVHHIDEEVSVVPRGLSHSEAGKLDSFLHFSEPKNLKKKSILETSQLNPAIDFLDVLSDDIPKGSWSLQFESGSKVCVLRSLLWLGLTFYHVPMTPQHGYIYIGNGAKNLDLPFML
ncbi:radial spoke head protein 9 homolog isoform X4 [Paralichthys olivaceus]|uniref:radial spoke head protein 9 homolog isoform X4 n=1 Tax=Paralichthys olivaceus TaxID=8255 RepID=UPI0037505B8D